MIDTPFYSVGICDVPSVDDGSLFHYTSFDNFMKIIQSMSLRSSPLFRMNDLNEANLDFIQWDNFLMTLDAERYVKNECSVICFSKNYSHGTYCQEGSNHPALWAHYADNSNGVCIVLDRDSLLEINRELLLSIFYRFESVKYDFNCAPNIPIIKEGLNISEFTHKYYKELFFKKHTDWSYEGEERFFVEKSEVYLDIKGAIKYIVLGGKVSKENLKWLLTEMITPGNNLYHYFKFHSYAKVIPDIFGYMTVDAALDVKLELEQMSKMSKLAEDYINWIDSNI